jgi:hypothetical protein
MTSCSVVAVEIRLTAVLEMTGSSVVMVLTPHLLQVVHRTFLPI